MPTALTATYRQEPVPVDIPGYSGELRGLSWVEGSEKFFATGFDLADDVEMEEVERQIFGG